MPRRREPFRLLFRKAAAQWQLRANGGAGIADDAHPRKPMSHSACSPWFAIEK
jgi:hypothetical protein